MGGILISVEGDHKWLLVKKMLVGKVIEGIIVLIQLCICGFVEAFSSLYKALRHFNTLGDS